MTKKTMRPAVALACWALIAPAMAMAAGPITPPRINGQTVGDDYFLANYTQLLEYWRTVEKESDRIKLEQIGKTAEGRPMMMAIITSPANHKKLARYKEISQRLGRAEGLTEEQARALANEGKAVVWIDGGLHANECINAQALFTETYEFLSKDDPETLRWLNDVILLLTPVNPDGMELVSNWYMREADPKKRNLQIPRLYQKYVGHDNNRDSYMVTQPETEAVNRQLYIEWIPQIMYNQHQTGPAGTVLFFAPFRDPFNYNQDPLVPLGIDLVGAAVHNRFVAEGKPGAVMRTGAPYSTWYNGGSRTTTGFHNQIGLLSEIIGNPTPMSIPLIASKLLPAADQPAPIGPRQEWHQRQSIEYMLTADRAILDVASRYREEFLYRIYVMGKNSIERGSRDHWTVTPKAVAAMEAAYAKEQSAGARAAAGGGPAGDSDSGFARPRGLPMKYWEQLHTPEGRDARGYIIPSNQADFLTATKFVATLQKCGVVVHRATAEFTVAGKTYPAGSFVIQAAQAFRPHLRDMLEPQDHPNDFLYPGGPPRPPYDTTGYTLAYMMGVQFDRILDGFTGPFEKIEGLAAIPPAKAPAKGAAGYLLSHQVNDSFPATTRLLSAGEDVYWLKTEFSAGGKTYPAGTIYIPAKATTAAQIERLARELGLSFDAAPVKARGAALQLRPVKVGLWDRYGGSMDSGWIRWLFEQAFPIPYERVYAPGLDAGDLKSKFDILIFPEGAIPDGAGRAGGRPGGAPEVPAEFKDQAGSITLAKTGPRLREFVEEGGTLFAIGRSANFGGYLGLPLTNALVETVNGVQRRLPAEKFYVPGSVLSASVDNTAPIAYGFSEKLDIFYDNNPAYRLLPDAAMKGLKPLVWLGPNSLRSGWAWGESYLNGTVAAAEAPVGKGKVYLFGPEITFRGQPHGTFKFLFNGIYLAGAREVTLP
jgi:hypothetical protein